MKLFEISETYQALMMAIENGEIEDEQAIADTLEAIEGTFSEKVDNIANMIQQYEAAAKALKEKADSITERAKQKQNRADSLKRYLSAHMIRTGHMKFESDQNKITFRRSEAVEIADETAFVEYVQKIGLDELLTYKAPTPNRTAIKAAIKNGAVLDGAALIEKQNMQIK